MRLMMAVAVVLTATAALSTSAAAQWRKDGMRVCAAEGSQYEPQIVTDGGNGVIIAWSDERFEFWGGIYAQRIDAAGTPCWTVDGALAGLTGCDRDVRAISDGAGGIILTWTGEASWSTGDIYVQRLDGAGFGLWGDSGSALCQESGRQFESQLVSDGAGGAIVTWMDTRNDQDDIYAQRIAADGTKMWADGGVAVCVDTFYQSPPFITDDGAGGAIIAWSDNRNLDADVYAQHLDASGAALWAGNGIPVVTKIGNQDNELALVSDLAGGAIIAWYTYEDPVPPLPPVVSTSDTPNRVTVQRISATGVRLWGQDGIDVSATGGDQDDCAMAADGDGGAVVVWVDRRTGEDDIRAQRFDMAGTAAWATDGVLVCGAEGVQADPQVAVNSVGGAFVVWTDRRVDYNTSDVYAQSLDPSGGAKWNIDGAPLSTASGSQDRGQVLAGPVGGVYFTWTEVTEPRDIYALRMDAAGFATLVPAVPSAFQLRASPNPFNPMTTFTFDLPEAGPMRLSVFDVAGRLIRTLVDDSRLRGSHEAVWDGRDSSGRGVGSGSYLARLESGSRVETVPVELLR